jgi:hypothetical protein
MGENTADEPSASTDLRKALFVGEGPTKHRGPPLWAKSVVPSGGKVKRGRVRSPSSSSNIDLKFESCTWYAIQIRDSKRTKARLYRIGRLYRFDFSNLDRARSDTPQILCDYSPRHASVDGSIVGLV